MSRLSLPSFAALMAAKYASRVFWTTRIEWVGHVPPDPWRNVRLIAVLNHTSLAEGVYLSAVPNRVIRRLATHGVAPIARETMERPIEGRIFRLLVPNPVAITRRRDHSWSRVMARVDDPDAMVALCPEGRMMRPNGRDKMGEPMTIKPGIADVLRALGTGRMIAAYSGGLHHVFPPDAKLPRFFRPMVIRIESIDIAEYIAERARERPSFVDAVVRDLTRRRDLYTPIAVGTPAAVSAEVVRRRHRAWRDRMLDAPASGDGNSTTAQRHNGTTAQRHNGTTAQRHNSTTAQQHNGITAQQPTPQQHNSQQREGAGVRVSCQGGVCGCASCNEGGCWGRAGGEDDDRGSAGCES